MARSRAFNRFHRFLARQKRRGLRSVLPQFRMDDGSDGTPIDHSRAMLSSSNKRETQLDLLEMEG